MMKHNDEYKVIAEIETGYEKRVVIRDSRGACVMSEDEWRHVYGAQHTEKWESVA